MFSYEEKILESFQYGVALLLLPGHSEHIVGFVADSLPVQSVRVEPHGTDSS